MPSRPNLLAKADKPRGTARFIPLLDLPGPWHMALDEWLLEEHRQGRMPPVLRFYTWSRATLSLGYHQRQWPAAWTEIQWQGQPLDWVRRPSGGRAVLHQGDLTYAIIASDLPPQRALAYRYLCEFLITGFRSLGLDLQYGSAGRGYIHNPDCFGTATAADLVLADGTKLIGSAQLWRHCQSQRQAQRPAQSQDQHQSQRQVQSQSQRQAQRPIQNPAQSPIQSPTVGPSKERPASDRAVLQHGSIRVRPDRALFEQVFSPASGPYAPLEPDIEAIVTALTAAARDCLGLDFVTQPLTPAEWSQVEERVGSRPGV